MAERVIIASSGTMFQRLRFKCERMPRRGSTVNDRMIGAEKSVDEDDVKKHSQSRSRYSNSARLLT